ncbi:MAG: EthD family reductase [Actinomycetales bacterium]|nr:EthD family reductase [Actinomycetales bacterium]
MTIRALTVLTRRPELSVPEFRAYWRDHHAPFGAAFPHLRSYTQHHVVDSIARGIPAPDATVDGFSDLIFASREHFDESLASDAAREASTDAARFIARMRMYVTEDHAVVSGDAANEVTSGAGFAAANRFGPGEAFPRHHHARATEIIVCTSGSLTIEIEGTSVELGVGQQAVILPGQRHQTSNRSGLPAELIYVKTPYDPDDVVWTNDK